jgi:hypothetical protein
MKPIVEKVLASGLVDKATAELMEKWGYLPEGSVDKVNEDKLKNATQETLKALANDLAIEVEKEHALRETVLDLERLKWPVSRISIFKPDPEPGEMVSYLAEDLVAMVDRMGRYFFRLQDVNKDWFVPGYHLRRGDPAFAPETILQSQVLFIGEQGVCVQVSTDRG